MGPEGGESGGKIIAQGPPEKISAETVNKWSLEGET